MAKSLFSDARPGETGLRCERCGEVFVSTHPGDCDHWADTHECPKEADDA